jgi:hypothetical protein
MPSPYKVTRAISMALTPEAECMEPGCEWASGPALGALVRVKGHVGWTGHTVRVEHLTRSIYRGAERPARKGVSP